MKLRDYQEAAADGVFREWADHASTLAVLPTGLGKTVLFAGTGFSESDGMKEDCE